MKRRDFIVVLGAALPWPALGLAQDKIPTIGILVLGNPDPAPFMKQLREGLAELGHIEGKTIELDFRSAGGDPAKLPQLAKELAERRVDVMVVFNTPAATAAKQATGHIPIVMDPVGDPVGTGLISSLARPGGNLTGVTGAGAELAAKNLELIREILPSTRRVAALANAPDPFSKPFLAHIEEAAKALNIELKSVLVQPDDALERHFEEIVKWKGQAIVVQPTLPLKRITELALKHKMPAFSPNANFPHVGGLISYSADQDALYRQGAKFVDLILKGRKPAELPVELPTKFWLAVNLKTAKAIGVTVPATILTRADDVIE